MLPDRLDPAPPPNPDRPGPGSRREAALPSRCDLCGVEAEAKYAEFHQCVAFVLAFRTTSVRGRLCRPCRDRCFWHHTTTSLAMGWWGPQAFLVNFAIIIINVYYRLKTRGLAPVDGSKLAVSPFPLDVELDSTTADAALGDPEWTAQDVRETSSVGRSARIAFLTVVAIAIALALWQIPACLSGPRGHEVAVDPR